MLDALRDIAAADSCTAHSRCTLVALWRRGLIKADGFQHWGLTPEGRLALKHGRQMLTERKP